MFNLIRLINEKRQFSIKIIFYNDILLTINYHSTLSKRQFSQNIKITNLSLKR